MFRWTSVSTHLATVAAVAAAVALLLLIALHDANTMHNHKATGRMVLFTSMLLLVLLHGLS
jgi:hypothetical protein